MEVVPAVRCRSWPGFVQAGRAGALCKARSPLSPQVRTSIISPGIQHPLKPSTLHTVLTYKALHTGQPCYLADLIDSYEPSRCLRSTNGHLLAVPSCVKSSFASRAFCVSLPNNWNSLPTHIRSSDSLVTFQSRLKSHLFCSAYHIYSHPHACASDLTFDYWRYIKYLICFFLIFDFLWKSGNRDLWIDS